MIHNGVSSAAPYFEEAKQVDIKVFGVAYVWRPRGTKERWLIPPTWVVAEYEKDAEGNEVLKQYTINQTGAIGDRLIRIPGDRIDRVTR